MANFISASAKAYFIDPASGSDAMPEERLKRIEKILETLHGAGKELLERRAEVMSRFHLVEAKRYERQGHENRARTHLLALLQGLRQNRPATEFVRLLYAEAEAMLAELNGRRLISAPAVGGGAAA